MLKASEYKAAMRLKSAVEFPAQRASGSQQRVVSRLRRRYTRVVKIGDKWNTYLQIDHQGFCVVEQTCHHRARWFAKNLAIALERMLAANTDSATASHISK